MGATGMQAPLCPAYGAIDSHAHLERGEYAEDLAAVLARAWECGLSGVVAVGSGENPAVFLETQRLAASDSRIKAAVGIHPHVASHADALWGPLRSCLGMEGVVALGELGLDFHYDFSPRPVQMDVMRRQLALARELGLPVVLHIREAFEESLRVLDELAPLHRGVVHCFSGSWGQAREYLDRGLAISVPGIVTFSRAADIRDAVQRIPEDRLLVETDSPYLAPVPFRGRRNEPCRVAHTLAEVAKLRGTDPAHLGPVTAANTARLFGFRG